MWLAIGIGGSCRAAYADARRSSIIYPSQSLPGLKDPDRDPHVCTVAGPFLNARYIDCEALTRCHFHSKLSHSALPRYLQDLLAESTGTDCAMSAGRLTWKRALPMHSLSMKELERGTNTRKLEVYRSDVGPAYLGHFYYVTSRGNRLSYPSLCRLCQFLKQTCPDSSNRHREYETYKLLAICSSESYLFEVPKKANRKRPEQRPWGEVDHNVFMAVVPEVPFIPKTGVPLRWFETDLPKIGSIYRLTQGSDDERYRVALPRVVGPRADMGLPNVWLGCCRQAHKFCTPKKVCWCIATRLPRHQLYEASARSRGMSLV